MDNACGGHQRLGQTQLGLEGAEHLVQLVIGGGDVHADLLEVVGTDERALGGAVGIVVDGDELGHIAGVGVQLTLGVVVQLIVALFISGHIVFGEVGEIHEHLVLNALLKAGGPEHANVGQDVGQVAGCNGNAKLLGVGGGGDFPELDMNAGELLRLLECLVVGKAVGHKGGHIVGEADPHGEGPVVVYQRQVIGVVGGDETVGRGGFFLSRGNLFGLGGFLLGCGGFLGLLLGSGCRFGGLGSRRGCRGCGAAAAAGT